MVRTVVQLSIELPNGILQKGEWDEINNITSL